MSFSIHCNILFDFIKKFDGLAHTYCISKEGILLDANSLQVETLRFATSRDRSEQIIGLSLREILGDHHGTALDITLNENKEVMESRKARQYFNHWIINETTEIKLLTIKIPYMNEHGEIVGIVGVSQYISKISIIEGIRNKLTARENECLSQLLDGKITKEIAHSLGVSNRTIEHHLDNIKGKLDCQSKSELLAKVIYSSENVVDKKNQKWITNFTGIKK